MTFKQLFTHTPCIDECNQKAFLCHCLEYRQIQVSFMVCLPFTLLFCYGISYKISYFRLEDKPQICYKNFVSVMEKKMGPNGKKIYILIYFFFQTRFLCLQIKHFPIDICRNVWQEGGIEILQITQLYSDIVPYKIRDKNVDNGFSNNKDSLKYQLKPFSF